MKSSARPLIKSMPGLTGVILALAVMTLQAAEFEDVEIFVVYSSTDQDAQVFVRAGSDDPLMAVKAIGPGRIVELKLLVEDGNHLGYADFVFESPEPSLASLRSAYPPGQYRFRGATVAGELVTGRAELSYDLLDAPVPIFPLDGDENVPTSGVTAIWGQIEDVEAIRFEVEDEQEEMAFKVDLPGSASSFNLPDGWLQPGTLDIKAISENGNQTVTDLRFSTAE